MREVLSLLKLQSAPKTPGRAVLRVPIQDIRLNPRQPRRQLQPESIAALAESIRRYGLLSPLLVRPLPNGGYELIAGERRLRALMRLERTHAEVIVTEADDCGSALMALVENLQREDLHYLDAAAACRRILESQPITQERLAASLSCSPSALANRLRLLKLPPEVQAAIRLSGLSERHARALLQLTDEESQWKALDAIVRRDLNVKQTEALIRQIKEKQGRVPVRVVRLPADCRLFLNAVKTCLDRLGESGMQTSMEEQRKPDGFDLVIKVRAKDMTLF